ncbi:MAG: EVE domain-containing protein, partial [Burkholderiales bacterium]|nr:EVE domain-containing protein [Burkholderiales bacterium]
MFDPPSPVVGRVPAATVPRNWIAVASADHARRGRDEMTPGFMQVCHGKCAPLKRMRPGDRVAYYAPPFARAGPSAASVSCPSVW